MSSIFPVPLNSSKITSSIREPVSISAVDNIVSEPPSFRFLAAPKNCLGPYSELGSKPPDKVFPLDCMVMLYALASLVILSNNITTSF